MVVGHEHVLKSHKAQRDGQGGANSDSKSKLITIIGYIASVLSVIMYVSYIPQIAANLSGHPAEVWQPLAAFVNCVFWTVYGFGCKPKQWPIVIANVPGIIFALATVITTFIH